MRINTLVQVLHFPDMACFAGDPVRGHLTIIQDVTTLNVYSRPLFIVSSKTIVYRIEVRQDFLGLFVVDQRQDHSVIL